MIVLMVALAQYMTAFSYYIYGNEISLQVWIRRVARPRVYILISLHDSLNNGLFALCDASRMLAACEEEHTWAFFVFKPAF